MKRLKIKHWLCLLSVIVSVALFSGCNSYYRDYYNNMADFGFVESEQVVEVDADTKSFRILGKWTEGNFDQFINESRFPSVYLDTINTTALDNVHFISHVDPEHKTIGYFTAVDSDKMYREREVKLLPENITSEVIIYYDIPLDPNIHNLIDRHKVILRPKTKENE